MIQSAHGITQLVHAPMASVDKTSVREEVSRLKADFHLNPWVQGGYRRLHDIDFSALAPASPYLPHPWGRQWNQKILASPKG